MKRMQPILPTWGKEKGQAKCTGCGQLGVYLGSWHCILSKSSTPQDRDGGRSQQVPDLASRGSSCPLPAQMHVEPTGRMLPAAHKVAVAPWLWTGQRSTVLSRWILMPSLQEEVRDLLKSKISCLLSQWYVKWLRLVKQAVLPLMGKQGCSLWSKHQHLLRRDWRRDKESFSVPFALSGGTMWALLLPAKDSWEETSNHEGFAAHYGFTLTSGDDYRTGKPHGLFSTNSLFNRQSKYENAFLTPPLVLKFTVMRRARVLQSQTIPGWPLQGLAFIAA